MDVNEIPPEFLTTAEKEKGGGWTVVGSKSKPKKNEKEAAKGAGGKSGTAVNGSGVFSSLEDQARERRAKIEAKKAEEEDGMRDDDEDEDEELEFEGQGEGAKAATEKKEEKKPKEKKPRITVAEAASKIDVSELSAFLTQISESYAAVPDVQLMRCADFFARAFASVTPALVNIPKIMKDSSMAKALEVPLADVPEPIVSITAAWLQGKSPEELGKFLVLLISVAVEDLVPPGKAARGQPQPLAPAKAKVGMLVVLAILLRKKPDIALQQAEAIRSNSSFHTQERLPMLAWVYGQVAQVELTLGMWLWSRNLLPLASGKLSTPISRDIILTFLESVLLKNYKKARTALISGAVRKGERLITPSALDLYLRLSFPAPDARTKATERFETHYQTIKAVALAGASRGKTSKPASAMLFPLAFKALGQDTTRGEACSLAVWCLSENAECYKQWEKHHLEELSSSCTLLSHLNSSWAQVKGQLDPLSDLRSFCKDVKAKHKAAADQTGSSKELARADALLAKLESRLSWVPACTRGLATLAVGAAMAYGFYLLSPSKNPWGWDGYLLLSKTHGPFKWPDMSKAFE